jgi:hypothetical protein
MLRLFWLLLFLSFNAFAEGSPDLPQKTLPGFAVLGNLGLLPVKMTTLSYGGWITPQSGDVEQHRFTFQRPLYQGATDSFSLSLGGTSLHFGDQPILSSGLLVPVDLWKAELGASYSHKIDDDRFSGARVSFGSASDHPFSNFDVTTIGVSAYYSWATSEETRWMLTLFFSNNNPIINYVPIPGVVYLYQTEKFIGLFGFPLSSVVWMPAPGWMFTLSFFGPTINSEIGFGNPRKTQFFLGYSWTQQSYLRENRPDPNDRMYYSEMHSPLGVRFLILDRLKTEFSTGYAFDRSVYEGVHLGSNENGTTSLGNSWFAAWNFRLEL